MVRGELTVTDAASSSAATTAEQARDEQGGYLAIIKSDLKPAARLLPAGVTLAKVPLSFLSANSFKL